MQPFQRGDDGAAVQEVQGILVGLGLLARVSGAFDGPTDQAVRAFQQARGISVDGRVGQETWSALDGARYALGDRLLLLAGRQFHGDDVFALQERLAELGFDTGRVDGVFGPRTETALKGLQRDYGLLSDGVCGPATLRALKQLGRMVTGGRATHLRESEQLHRSGTSLLGKVVVLDPGHGGADRGAVGHGLAEADLTWDLATRLEGRLAVAGVRTLLTRSPETCPTDAERARFANHARADLLLSLHVDSNAASLCEGVSTYHFGTGTGATSTVGEQLAGFVQREVVARTGLLDGHVHAKTWEILRLTEMPTVRVELGYLSNPSDAARLGSAAVRDQLAEGMLIAVQRLYLPAELDPATGVLRLPDLARL